jgi:hypothetical protein
MSSSTCSVCGTSQAGERYDVTLVKHADLTPQHRPTATTSRTPEQHRKALADMSTRHHDTTLPGEYAATPDARAAIEHIETAVTDYCAGAQLDVADIVDKALSLAGLTITIDSQHNRACIQAR